MTGDNVVAALSIVCYTILFAMLIRRMLDKGGDK